MIADAAARAVGRLRAHGGTNPGGGDAGPGARPARADARPALVPVLAGALSRALTGGPRTRPAQLPPPLPGLDPAWSRLVTATASEGVARTWHVLDGESLVREATGAAPVGVVLAVHGNPTWSYAWRSVLVAAASAGWRVVAVDQLEMGFSERTGRTRRLADRLADLDGLTDALGLAGAGPARPGSLPVVALGHDWGGVVVSGWAGARAASLAGLALLNTAVSPAGAPVPPALRWVTASGVLDAFCVTTPGFLRATLATARRPLPPDVADAYAAPYAGRARRAGIGAFVADIPADAHHPSRPALDAVAAGVSALGAAGTPSLLVWGPADPVFRPRYLRDLRDRLPGGDVHLVAGAGHLVVEDADVAGILARWLGSLGGRARPVPAAASPAAPVGVDPVPVGPAGPSAGTAPVTAALAERARGPLADTPAVVQLRPDGERQVVSWRALDARVDALVAGLADLGVLPGSRVSLLVPPGPDLSALFTACLRLGAVVVVADAGLGVSGLSRAVRSASPDVVVGVSRALVAATVLRWPGRRVVVAGVLAAPDGAGSGAAGAAGARGAGPALARLVARGEALAGAALVRVRSSLRVETDVDTVAERGRALLAAGAARPPAVPDPGADAAVLFTSGSTGPAKGVVYTHARLAAMREALAATYGLGPDAPLVAAFAPFALLGPLLGATTAVPATDVTAPHTLTARALADAVAAVGARAVFASPAALANTVATADELRDTDADALGGVRLLLSAGAPVGADLLAAAAALFPAASARTPYGMTEVLPVTDVTLDELLAAGRPEGGERAGGGDPPEGVLVGAPVAGVRLAVAPLDVDGTPTGRLTSEPGLTGEVAVSAAHVKERYDQLWDVQRASAVDAGWHRTGDVGHLDASGRLWVEGRLAHVVTTAAGALTPVGVEQRVQGLDAVRRAALVGVGPVGAQVPVVVVEAAGAGGAGAPALAPGLAPLALVDAVRAVAATPVPVAAVLVVAVLPTDVRHRSKVDRTAVAAWAADVLSGGSPVGRTPWRAPR